MTDTNEAWNYLTEREKELVENSENFNGLELQLVVVWGLLEIESQKLIAAKREGRPAEELLKMEENMDELAKLEHEALPALQYDFKSPISRQEAIERIANYERNKNV